MKFAAIIEYIPDKARVSELRPLHRQYLTALRERGQLAVAGPFTDDSGALIVYEAATKDEAKKLLEGDPFNQNGIFVKYLIRPWNPVMINQELFP
ncbi:MAG: YciI family protein [Gemmataceae bacterium]